MRIGTGLLSPEDPPTENHPATKDTNQTQNGWLGNGGHREIIVVVVG